MKVKFIGALLLAIWSGLYSVAQTVSINRLSCGAAELRLGMPESAVYTLLESNGYTQTSSITSVGVKAFSNEGGGPTCHVEFDKHSLVFVARYWTPPSDEAQAAIETVIDMVQSVTRKNTVEHCEVFPYEKREPDQRIKYISIKCNGHLIGITMTHDFRTKINSFDIDEEIGMRNEERNAKQKR